MGSGRTVATIPTGQRRPAGDHRPGQRRPASVRRRPGQPVPERRRHRQRKVVDNNVLVGNGTVAIATARTAAGPRAYLAQLDYSRLGVLDTAHRADHRLPRAPARAADGDHAPRWPHRLGRELLQRRDLGRSCVRQQDRAHRPRDEERPGQLGRLHPPRHPRLGQRSRRRLGRQCPQRQGAEVHPGPAAVPARPATSTSDRWCSTARHPGLRRQLDLPRRPAARARSASSTTRGYRLGATGPDRDRAGRRHGRTQRSTVYVANYGSKSVSAVRFP